jgi:hypothetical protein
MKVCRFTTSYEFPKIQKWFSKFPQITLISRFPKKSISSSSVLLPDLFVATTCWISIVLAFASSLLVLSPSKQNFFSLVLNCLYIENKMPRYYCDYCDAYLTHDSMTGRQQHMRGLSLLLFVQLLFLLLLFHAFPSFLLGWKHRENFKNYYNQFYPQWIVQQQALQLHLQMQFQSMLAAGHHPSTLPGMPPLPPAPHMGAPPGYPGSVPPLGSLPPPPPPNFLAPPPTMQNMR